MKQDIQGCLQSYYSDSVAEVLAPQISNLNCISTGWESNIYSFALRHGKANQLEHKELILRIYSGEEAPQRSVREYHCMSQLHSAGFPVPQVLLLERENSPFSGNLTNVPSQTKLIT